MQKKEPSPWDKYINGYLMNIQVAPPKSSKKPEEKKADKVWIQKISEHAAILDQKGNILAATPGFNLGTYTYDMQVDDKNVKKVPIDEKKILSQVVLAGATDCEAGVRINNQKHMLVNYDPAKKLAYFSKVGGGACAMATKTTIVFASYNSSLPMSDGNAQNPGLCNQAVEQLAQVFIKSNT